MVKSKNGIVLVLLGTILLLDRFTKSWAVEALAGGRRIDLFGGLVPLTLTFNRGAAFGITLGDDPRWLFIPMSLIAIGYLTFLLREARPDDYLRIVSTSLLVAGATGNLIDRIRWDQGVVDFIGPINLGFMLWPIFNVADSCITVGVPLLAASLVIEDLRERRSRQSPAGAGDQVNPEAPGSERT